MEPISFARSVLARIPLFASSMEANVRPLEDVISLNNSNYRVSTKSGEYLLRIGNDSANWFGIDRKEEIEIATAAAKEGLAPEILFSEASGLIVTPYIEGFHWKPEDCRKPGNLLRIGDTLRFLHSIKTARSQNSQFRRIEVLLENSIKLGMTLPEGIEKHKSMLLKIELQRIQRVDYASGLSHNDFWLNNFLDDGMKLWLLDWEFSGNGDGYVDLATFSLGCSLSEEEQKELLFAYGSCNPFDFEDLQAMKWAVCFFEAAWALVHHGLQLKSRVADHNPVAFDYADHAAKMFERIESGVYF